MRAWLGALDRERRCYDDRVPHSRTSASLLGLMLASCQVGAGLGLQTAHNTPPPAPVANESEPSAAPGGIGISQIAMPDVTGKSRTDAEAAIRAAGLRGKIEVDLQSGPSSREVCRQVPSPGGKTNSTFTLTLEMCTRDAHEHVRPELEGLSVEAATKLAKASGYTGKIEVHYLDEYAAGCKDDTVCRVDPFRWELLEGSQAAGAVAEQEARDQSSGLIARQTRRASRHRRADARNVP